MSQGLGLATILGCLNAGENVAGLRPVDWVAGLGANILQKDFLKHQLGLRPGMKAFANELKAYATTIHPDVIATMHEWKMRLDDLPEGGPGAVYMISQLKEMLKWKVAGERVTRDGISWPEFVLKDHVRFFTYGPEGDKDVVVRIEVENDDFVYLTSAMARVTYDIWHIADEIEAEMKPASLGYSGVQIPCIDADIEADLNWILGMRNRDFFISYAQQKIRFGMNELGFAVREETAMMMEKCMRMDQPYLLAEHGEPFLFWRRRQGVNFPISIFEFTLEDFKDPDDLQKIVE